MIIRSARKGITLVELLTTITVVSILAITAYLVVPPQINKAFDARRKADLYQIKFNLEIYYGMAEQFPRNLPGCGRPLTYNDEIILTSMPCDPTTKRPYYYQTKGGNPESYRLYTLLANTQDPSIKVVGCLSGCGPDCAYNYGVSSMNINLTRCSYVCAPGGGQLGSCELYQDTGLSLCPKIYSQDATCNNECSDPINRCKNASGKHTPF
jgi:prepilin-type N-terminal cleavage/methylation domain-containing protein